MTADTDTYDLPPDAPEVLSPRSRTLWEEITDGYTLSAAELAVLEQALISLDRADQAAAVVVAEGVVVVDRYGSPKQHPAADVEARSRVIFARLVQQLGVRLDKQTRRP